MTNERTTKEVKLERAGATVVLFDYITGRDKRAIEGIYLAEAHISQKTNAEKKGEIEIGGVTGAVNHLMQDAALKAVIKEIVTADGQAITDRKKVVDFVLDLPEVEYTQVMDAVNEITDPKKA